MEIREEKRFCVYEYIRKNFGKKIQVTHVMAHCGISKAESVIFLEELRSKGYLAGTAGMGYWFKREAFFKPEPLYALSKESIFQKLETGVTELVDMFLSKPYAFYTESDLHCFLYHTLCKLGLNQACRCRMDKQLVESILLHKEYPTKVRYRRYHDMKSKEDKRGSRGHFDISIWDPDLTEQREFQVSGGKGEQRVLAAVELSLNEHHKNFQWHVYWDLLKLKDPKNEVERGIILFFVRDYPYSKTLFPRNGFIKTLHKMFGNEDEVPIVYVEKLGAEERKGTISKVPFLKYQSLEP
jgi:hypothetical protein